MGDSRRHEPVCGGGQGRPRGGAPLTWGALGAPHSHAAAVLSDAVVGDLSYDLTVGLQVEQQDVVRLQVPVDDHGRVEVPGHRLKRGCTQVCPSRAPVETVWSDVRVPVVHGQTGVGVVGDST